MWSGKIILKGLTQATFEPETDRLIWELMEEKGLELEKQVPGFQISVTITAEDFDSLSLADNIPVFVFCQAYREKSTEIQNIGILIQNSF